MSDTVVLTETRSATEVPKGPLSFESLASLRRYASPVFVVCCWQAACSSGFLSTRLVSSPVQIAVTGWAITRDGTLPYNLGVSLLRAASGLGLALILGVLLALLSGLSKAGEDIVDAPL